jgi:hypothetical protein
MSVYKPFTTSDIILSPFEVNKSFTFNGISSITGSGIDRFIGKNIPLNSEGLWVSGSNPTGEISSQDQFLVYRSIRELYYSNFIGNDDGAPAGTASFNDDGTITGPGYTPNSYNYLSSTLLANRYFPTGSNEIIGVFSIPSNLFGENIKLNSCTLTTPNFTLSDDGNGNLLNNSTSKKVGDIIYEHGIIILTSDGAPALSSLGYGFVNYGSAIYGDDDADWINAFMTEANITCSFESTITLYESQYKCTIRENEYNFSQNPTIISSSSNSGVVSDFATGSYFSPYTTTVGLYNNDKQLLAVGKLAQPLPLSSVTDTNIIINLDL